MPNLNFTTLGYPFTVIEKNTKHEHISFLFTKISGFELLLNI